MNGCICLAHYYSILVNGTVGRFFPFSRKGLRQGDPLFLFLFAALSYLLRRDRRGDLFKGFEIGPINWTFPTFNVAMTTS